MVDKCFLTVPLKSAEDVGYVQPIKLTIGSLYTKQSADHALFGARELEGLRRNALGRVLDKTTNSLEILYRYYDQLGSLESKIPGVSHKIQFRWMNAFEKPGMFSSGKPLAQNSIAFEKNCVLFNAAALLSQIAANQSLELDEGLKEAMRCFQLSAGIFQYVKDHIQASIQQDPTPDIHQDTLAALVSLMIAQAQEVCFFKASKDQMKDAVVAKVAAQTADYYDAAQKLMQKDGNIRAIWEKDWINVVKCKSSGFLGISEYYASLGHKAEKEFGEELSRLKVAVDAMNSSKKVFDGTSYPFKRIDSVIQKAYELAKKDNDFIYHVAIPAHATLEPIARASLVKPTVLSFPLSHNFVELFQPLVALEPSKCIIC